MYRVILSKRVYEELRSKLPEPHARMGQYLYLLVDDTGRAVIEAKFLGRVNWNAHQTPEARQ